MLKVTYHRNFKKDFQKLQKNVQAAFGERVTIFLENPKFPLLFDHPLKGEMKGRRAFSVTGSFRTIYEYIEKDKIKLLSIGNHPHVY